MLLSATLRQLPRRMWLFKPSTDRWSVHETILHLADSEATSYVRCRHLIAEPGRQAAGFDAGRWAMSLGYFHQSTREALEIIQRLRKMTHALLMTVPDPVWLHTIDHPREGESSLERWVARQEAHIPKHIGQIVKNYEVWLESNPRRKPVSRADGRGPLSDSLSMSVSTC